MIYWFIAFFKKKKAFFNLIHNRGWDSLSLLPFFYNNYIKNLFSFKVSLFKFFPFLFKTWHYKTWWSFGNLMLRMSFHLLHGIKIICSLELQSQFFSQTLQQNWISSAFRFINSLIALKNNSNTLNNRVFFNLSHLSNSFLLCRNPRNLWHSILLAIIWLKHGGKKKFLK